ncbi:MAG: CoA-binding protein [Armatimonadetes bacterium]|nr:CoA-binding protein [Armatimonadota bacterium]
MSHRLLIDTILSETNFAVTGVSRDREKYGYKVYQALKAAGYRVYPVNPNADTIDGDACYPSLDSIPVSIDCLVTVTPPEVTEATLYIAGRLKIPFVWMQPGSESLAAVNGARAFSMQVISGGPCIMVLIKQRQARLVAY